MMDTDDPEKRSAEPIRCLLRPYPSGSMFKRRLPPLVIDVGNDGIRVSDANTNALVASAALAELTATPAKWTFPISRFKSVTVPALKVGVPGLQPLIITTTPMEARAPRPFSPQVLRYRFSWGGTVDQVKRANYLITDAEFLALAGKFGLASNLQGNS